MRGEAAETRDEHTACVYENEASMVVFGGFIKGVRTNTIEKYLIQEGRWVKVQVQQQAS